MEDDLSIGIFKVPIVDLYIMCDCGTELRIDLKEWKLEIKGELFFKCPRCGIVIRTLNPEAI